MKNQYGLPKFEREKLIKQRIESSSGKERVFFGDKAEELVKISMPIESLIYRIENFRTESHQEDYIAKKGLEKNFYRDNPQSPEIQELQHQLLEPLTVTGGATSLKNQFIKQEKKQTEALLINNRGDDGIGVVINGNRRLCAWREAYNSNSAKFSHFKEIDCLVLPSSFTEVDEEDIEYKLQVTEDLKQDYDWVGDTKAKANRINKIISDDSLTALQEVAKASGIEVNRLKSQLLALELATDYLRDFLGEENRWSMVIESEQAFFTLAQKMSDLKAAHERDTLKELAFQVISKDFRGMSKHSAILYIAKNSSKVLTKVTSDKDFNSLDKKDKRAPTKKGAKTLPKPRGDINSPVVGFKPGVLTDLIVQSIEELTTIQRNQTNYSTELSRIHSSIKTLNRRFDKQFAHKDIPNYLTKVQDSLEELIKMKAKLESLKKK